MYLLGLRNISQFLLTGFGVRCADVYASASWQKKLSCPCFKRVLPNHAMESILASCPVRFDSSQLEERLADERLIV